MSREAMVAVVEAFLDGLAAKDVAGLPIAAEVTVESPLMRKVGGAKALEYVKSVSAGVKAITVHQHIVEGEHVASVFDEQVGDVWLPVFGRFRIVDGRITDIRVYYDPRPLLRTRAAAHGAP